MYLLRNPLLRMVFALLALMVATALPVHAAEKLTVYAAASLTESLDEAANAYAKLGHERPSIAYAASSQLARQIEAGAPAAIFISADEPWADYVEAKGLAVPATRKALLGNALVLITPAAQPLKLKIQPGFALKAALGGSKLALGDPDSVPAGRYAKAALTSLGVWSGLEPIVVRADSVRSALRFVETGAARAGIVYTTDARASNKVSVVDTFPANTHAKIIYPILRIARNDSQEARAFYDYLSSKPALAIFARHGFTRPDTP